MAVRVGKNARRITNSMSWIGLMILTSFMVGCSVQDGLTLTDIFSAHH